MKITQRHIYLFFRVLCIKCNSDFPSLLKFVCVFFNVCVFIWWFFWDELCNFALISNWLIYLDNSPFCCVLWKLERESSICTKPNRITSRLADCTIPRNNTWGVRANTKENTYSGNIYKTNILYLHCYYIFSIILKIYSDVQKCLECYNWCVNVLNFQNQNKI